MDCLKEEGKDRTDGRMVGVDLAIHLDGPRTKERKEKRMNDG